MSTGKRLAKRSIIGMRVCALAEDGLYYPGRIHAVKTPASPKDNQNCINLTPNTRYSVRFDPNPVFGPQRRGIYEFSCSELIGDGFGSITDVKLKPDQKIYITHNGRETGGTVVEHDIQMDEVTIQIQATANEVSLNNWYDYEEKKHTELFHSSSLEWMTKRAFFSKALWVEKQQLRYYAKFTTQKMWWFPWKTSTNVDCSSWTRAHTHSSAPSTRASLVITYYALQTSSRWGALACVYVWNAEVFDLWKFSIVEKKLRIMWSWIDIACIVRAFSLLFRQGCSHICFPMTLKFTHSSFGLESQSFSKFSWGLVWRTLFAGVWYAATSYLPQNTMRSHARQK